MAHSNLTVTTTYLDIPMAGNSPGAPALLVTTLHGYPVQQQQEPIPVLLQDSKQQTPAATNQFLD